MFVSIDGFLFNLKHVVRVNHVVDIVFITTTDGKYTSLNCDESQYQNLLSKIAGYNAYLQQGKRECKPPINLL